MNIRGVNAKTVHVHRNKHSSSLNVIIDIVSLGHTSIVNQDPEIQKISYV